MQRPCEAPYHVPGCSGVGSTKDHITPRCIAKLLGWTPKQLGSPENLQYLSPACHNQKDKTTPLMKQLVKAQLQGKEIKFGDHQRYIRRRFRGSAG